MSVANGASLRGEMFWIDRWIGSSAFLLPAEARGVYREMLTQAWRRGAKLPNDHEAIRRATAVTTDEWTRAWPLIAKYWRVDGDSIVNDTQLEVYAETKRRIDAVAHRASLGGHARAQAVPKQVLKQVPKLSPGTARAGAQAVHSVSVSVSGSVAGSGAGAGEVPTVPAAPSAPQEPAPKNGAVSVERFQRFWDAYPAKKGKAQALKTWKRLNPSETLTDAIVAAVQQQAEWPEWTKEQGQFIPHPATWLNQGRWDDEPRTPTLPLLSDIGRQNRINGAIAIKRILGEES